MTPTEIIAAFDTHLPPDIAERAKRAYEKAPNNGYDIAYYVNAAYPVLGNIDWAKSDEGWGFWQQLCHNGYIQTARALLAPDYKEMWEKEKELREKFERVIDELTKKGFSDKPTKL